MLTKEVKDDIKETAQRVRRIETRVTSMMEQMGLTIATRSVDLSEPEYNHADNCPTVRTNTMSMQLSFVLKYMRDNQLDEVCLVNGDTTLYLSLE